MFSLIVFIIEGLINFYFSGSFIKEIKMLMQPASINNPKPIYQSSMEKLFYLQVRLRYSTVTAPVLVLLVTNSST